MSGLTYLLGNGSSELGLLILTIAMIGWRLGFCMAGAVAHSGGAHLRSGNGRASAAPGAGPAAES